MMTIEAFYDVVHRASTTWYQLQPADAEQPPLLLMLHSDGQISLCSLAFVMDGTDMGKQTAFEIHRQSLKTKRTDDDQGHVAASAMIIEGWMRTTTDLDDAMEGRVSQHPDREECLVVNILTPLHQAVMYCKLDRATKTLSKPPFLWLNGPGGETAVGAFIRE